MTGASPEGGPPPDANNASTPPVAPAERAGEALLHVAVEAFLEAWDLALPAIQNACAISAMHGVPYTGPSLAPTVTRLRALSAGPEAQPTPSKDDPAARLAEITRECPSCVAWLEAAEAAASQMAALRAELAPIFALAEKATPGRLSIGTPDGSWSLRDAIGKTPAEVYSLDGVKLRHTANFLTEDDARLFLALVAVLPALRRALQTDGSVEREAGDF